MYVHAFVCVCRVSLCVHVAMCVWGGVCVRTHLRVCACVLVYVRARKRPAQLAPAGTGKAAAEVAVQGLQQRPFGPQ